MKSEKGQSMVEFALVLPILLLLLCGILDLGWIFGNQLMAISACRDAARYTAIHYNDSQVDDDRAVAAALVSSRAPTLKSPVVTLLNSVTDSSITVQVSCDVELLSPLLSGFFSGGVYSVNTQSTMRLE